MMKIKGLVPVVLVMNEEHWLPYALESTRGYFDKYVIYDVGSTDRTRDIIHWFVQTNPDVEFHVDLLPFVPPIVQGKFRNSMIAETQSDYYFILDGDEVYTKEGLDTLRFEFAAMQCQKEFHPDVVYGVIKRREFKSKLKLSYKKLRKHHRVYHRTAVWGGTHPGEYPLIAQNNETEFGIIDTVCYHFHNTIRSSKEEEVPKRLERKRQKTYHPGNELEQINLLDILPILRKPIEDFPVNPSLKELQNEYKV